jgi:DnaJ-class molecular chaperone
MQDHYQTLGVARTATDDDIKRAYRRLASKHHPDKGGNTQDFQKIEEAYRILGDPDQRRQYDNPEIRININNGGFQNSAFDFDTIFEMFGARMHPRNQQAQRNQRIGIWIDLEDVAQGGNKILALTTGQGVTNIEIKVPPGIQDNENVRYPGLAPGGFDLVVNFRVKPHAQWHRDDLNLYTEKALDFWQLILGTDLFLKDIQGREIMLTVPPRTRPGTMLRARGRGLSRAGHNTGDLMVRLQAVMPADIPDEIIDVLRKNQINK